MTGSKVQGRSDSAAPRGVLAISGPDRVGKSTQIRIFRRAAEAAVNPGSICDYWPPGTAAIISSGWFTSVPIERLVDVLASSYLARAAAVPRDRVAILDRGIAMLDATIAATVAVREGLSDDAAATRAASLLASYRTALAKAEEREHGIVILHDADPAVGAEAALGREHRIDATYAAYQRRLHRQIQRLIAEGRFAHAIVTKHKSIMEVQNELRLVAQSVFPRMQMSAVPHVGVVALGGLSESGKSTAAARLQQAHGYARLKIGYLLKTAAARLGIADPHALDPTLMAEVLVEGLNDYCAGHAFVDRVTIESLHRHDMTVALRNLLGRSLTVVFVDAAPAVRRARGVAGPQDVDDRDLVKIGRGADRIREIADKVVCNDGPVVALRHAVDRLSTGILWPFTRPRVAPVEQLRLPNSVSQFLGALIPGLTERAVPLIDLIAVTGSSARGGYLPGWSDLDMLLVADHDGHQELRQIVATHEPLLGGVKLGLTVVSQAECLAASVPPRVLHVLRELGTHRIAAQWCRDGLCLPTPPHDADATVSLLDAVAAAVALRRLLLNPVSAVRPLYKTASLLAKVLLRAEGVDAADDAAALLFFQARLPPGSAGDPKLARTDADAAEGIATTVLQAWLGTYREAGR